MELAAVITVSSRITLFSPNSLTISSRILPGECPQLSIQTLSIQIPPNHGVRDMLSGSIWVTLEDFHVRDTSGRGSRASRTTRNVAFISLRSVARRTFFRGDTTAMAVGCTLRNGRCVCTRSWSYIAGAHDRIGKIMAMSQRCRSQGRFVAVARRSGCQTPVTGRSDGSISAAHARCVGRFARRPSAGGTGCRTHDPRVV